MSQISISMSAASPSTVVRAHIRNHEILVDRPESKGGSNAGPMGGEMLLAALGGCFVSTLIAAAKARSVHLGELAVTVVGRLAESPARLESVELVVASSCESAVLEHVVEVAHRGCLVATTLRHGMTIAIALAGADE